MTKQKTNTILFFIAIAIFTISCTTAPTTTYSFDWSNPYPGKVILQFPNSRAYLFPNEESDKLIIIIEGSGWTSMLGVKQNNRWVSVFIGSQILIELRNDYNILILEKLNRQPGMVYINDMEDRANYTAENVIAGYLESINSFLNEHEISSVVLLGASEGAMLLPLIYEKMNNKDSVTAMVSIAFGGLSMYESYRILSTTRTGWSQNAVEMFNDVLTRFNPENSEFPDCYEEDYFSKTLRWYSSFFHIRPFDYLKNIDIPILFIHGRNDTDIPVESTFYIQENLPDKPFEFKYFPWGHGTRSINETIEVRRLIAQWILAL